MCVSLFLIFYESLFMIYDYQLNWLSFGRDFSVSISLMGAYLYVITTNGIVPIRHTGAMSLAVNRVWISSHERNRYSINSMNIYLFKNIFIYNAKMLWVLNCNVHWDCANFNPSKRRKPLFNWLFPIVKTMTF